MSRFNLGDVVVGFYNRSGVVTERKTTFYSNFYMMAGYPDEWVGEDCLMSKADWMKRYARAEETFEEAVARLTGEYLAKEKEIKLDKEGFVLLGGGI